MVNIILKSIIVLVTLLAVDKIRTVDGEFIGSYSRSRPSGRGFTKVHPCEQGSCYPATGNLLIGREHQLYASSTCGLYKEERFCIVAHTKDPKKCFWCDSRPTKTPKPNLNHNISNVVYKLYPGTRHKTWWQSENGKENVYIQLDLEAEFHFTHLIIVFNTFKPAAMLIERSYDFKKTWHPYRYFAHNCEESFPHIPKRIPQNLTDVVCETRYSSVEPSSNGEVIYRVLLSNLRIDNPYSDKVQNLLKMTNLRINFTKLHTLGDDLLDNREDIQEKYYYAISQMIVRGSCSCYGHANRCLPIPGIDPKPDMVHGRCECTHNTKGRNCEKCEDFFNDLPWKPAVGKKTNACKRCNCNNHATSCHFDSAVYESSGRISGGVCDGCKHNTMGTKCDQCKPYFYRDPERDIQDPEVCRHCDCDPHGSLDNGICDSVTDIANEKVAGSCHCKEFVEGRRCDICKSGYWNFTASNPQGCQPCHCNTLGTINNQGCNMFTGECTCKRYVIGRDCTQCLPEYWGLSEEKDGCRPCNCDPGGSYNNNCDIRSGQCICRDEMTGLTCNRTKDQHFVAGLDFLIYEAELAKASSTCRVVIREPFRDGRKETWTGLGFMKTNEGSNIDFIVDNIRTSMNYDLRMHYESNQPKTWDDVGITIVRPGPVDPNGPCAGMFPESDILRVQLPPHLRKVTAPHPICLEAGQTYNVRLDFNHYQRDRETPTASVLIDSIGFIPRVDDVPWFNGTPANVARKEDYLRHSCSDYIQSANLGPIPEVCKHHFNSISAYVFNGARSCHCDPTGSTSKICNPDGGSCSCKVLVVGRRCDRCAPGTYGFGPEGCKPCDCNSIGALNNFCNVTTGQCECRSNTYGRECDQCRIGFWNFPNCLRCECNGHADTCNARTGACIDCRDNTQGHFCEQCSEGYYGDPKLNVNIPCRSCPCPGVPGSGHSYAKKCSLDQYTMDVVCECQEGYSGARCDVCADNFYGNPEVPGGSCQPCDCNEKIDLLRPGNCDPHTGKCKQCLYETTGDHCEVCRPGFYRTHDEEQCIECVCHILGTNSTAGPCNPHSGQCNCLPNVTGPLCDQCMPNFWKIASGEGCEACNCDAIGSTNSQCNVFDGQCPCKSNYGGRQCNECKANYWGNPKEDDCHACECNIEGSETLQCDRKTGACVCRSGIGGHNCDRCTRGFLGKAPYCRPCGECFDNWDRILSSYRNETIVEIERARNIKNIGATGAYAKEFKKMQLQLNEVEELLNNKDNIDLASVEDGLDKLRKDITEIESNTLKELDDILANATEGNSINKIHLEQLQKELALLKGKTKELENNGTILQEGNVQGALTLIHQARDRANMTSKIQEIQSIFHYVDRQCKATENKISSGRKEFEEMRDNDKQSLEEIKNNLEALEDEMPGLNHLVCDGNGDPCDVCGGAGCGSCGNSISCPDGAKQQAETAFSLANETESILLLKEDRANDLLRNMVNTTSAKRLAQEAYDKAHQALLSTNNSLTDVKDIKQKITDFHDVNNNKTSIDDIKNLADEVVGLNIKASREEINDLSEKIKDVVETLTNIDPIIEDTKDDLKKAKELKARAEYAKSKVAGIQNTTAEVTESIKNSTGEQKNAEEEIQKVTTDYKKVKDILEDVYKKILQANSTNNNTASKVSTLKDQLNKLQKEMTQNDYFAGKLLNEAQAVHTKANSTKAKLKELQTKYDSTKQELNDTTMKVENSKLKVSELMTRSLNLSAYITKVENDIKKLQLPNSDELLTLQDEIKNLTKKMDGYNTIIQSRAEYYKSCTS